MRIIVLADKKGNVQTITRDVVGSSCVTQSNFVDSKLGIIADDIHTEEYDGTPLMQTQEQTIDNTTSQYGAQTLSGRQIVRNNW